MFRKVETGRGAGPLQGGCGYPVQVLHKVERVQVLEMRTRRKGPGHSQGGSGRGTSNENKEERGQYAHKEE